MNFEDPLGDILSDGSNDSFFEESAKPTIKRTKTPEKKSITELFNLSESKSAKKTEDWLGLDVKDDEIIIQTKSPAKTANRLSKKISFEDDDILGNLGLAKKDRNEDNSKIEAKSSKKLDLLESILGTPTTNKTTEDNKKRDFCFDDILKESKVAKAQDIKSSRTEIPSETPSIGPTPREGRRGGRRSSGGATILDPLGLFPSDSKGTSSLELNINKSKDNDFDLFSNKPSTPVEPQAISRATPSKSAPNISSESGLPDWLGGTPVKSAKSEGALITPQKSRKNSLTDQKSLQEIPNKRSEESESGIQIDDSTFNSFLTQQKLVNSNVEYQNSALALQQQETQVLMALQLKKYEDRLADLQYRQQDVLVKQERQFSELLERQFAKQQIMENNLKLQQERINNHIQMLLSQPSVTKFPNQEEVEELRKSATEENAKIYENMISSLKQRQHEEIFLMDESYKKQISLLGQSLEAVEKRLKSDSEKLTQSFGEQLETITKQHEEEIARFKQKLEEIEEEHRKEIRQIRENHERVVDEIRHEHTILMENIKQSRQSESALFGESRSYLEKLDGNFDILSRNSQSIVQMKEAMEKDYGIFTKAREESLKAKENEINLMRGTLDKCRESAEEERTQLLGLVRSLEMKIAEQSQNAREERWALQQAASTFAARSSALDRETEFSRNSLERERDQLKVLRESILAEQEKLMLEFTEEKLSISAEKSRLQTVTKLNGNFDSQKAKAEMEAALKVAKEAVEMTDKERENLHRQQNEIERLKRSLLDQERKLNLREKDIDDLLKEAERKIADGDRAIYESKSTENKYNDRLRELQMQLNTLSVREKKLAEEKILLSKERLALNTLMRQTKRCGLCSADAPRIEEIAEFNIINPYLGRFDEVTNEISHSRFELGFEETDDINSERNVRINL